MHPGSLEALWVTRPEPVDLEVINHERHERHERGQKTDSDLLAGFVSLVDFVVKNPGPQATMTKVLMTRSFAKSARQARKSTISRTDRHGSGNPDRTRSSDPPRSGCCAGWPLETSPRPSDPCPSVRSMV